MESSKAGYVLLLISGILTLIVAVLVLVGSLFLNWTTVENWPAGVGIILFVLIVILGVVKLYAGWMMLDPKKTFSGGLIALIVGILSGVDLLAIIGGIIGMVQGSK